MQIQPFQYSSATTPPGYVCSCGASGVRLFREYETVLEHQSLTCAACIERETGREVTTQQDTAEWKVGAVPTEDGCTFWGFSSVPSEGVAWWKRLPLKGA